MQRISSSVIHHLSSERDRFVLWAPVLLATGAGAYFGLRHEPLFTLPLALLFLFAAGIWALRKNMLLRVAATLSFLILLGFMAALARTHMVATPVIYGELYYRDVEGRIDDIQDREKGARLILKDVSIERLPERRTPVRVSVTLKKDVPGLAIGDRVRVKASMFAPPAPAMPGGYDFTRALYFDRIGAVGYSITAPEILERGEVSGFSEWLTALRLRLNARILAGMGRETGPVAAALMVGEQSAVPRDVGDAMRDAGLYHVLSISGLHMSIAVALLFVTIRFLFSLYPPLALRLPVKKIAAALGLLGALAYLLLAGYPVPAVRSFVMVACVMLAVLFDRSGISLYSLAWAATLIILFQPEAVFGASFQLSFAATLAIVAFYERYSHVVYQSQAGLMRKLMLYIFALTVTSFVATLATTPLVIYHFNRFTLWGIAANTLMLPLASFWIMPAAVLAFIAMPLGLERWPLQWLDEGIRLMIAGSRWVADFPHAAFAMPSPTFWGFLLIVYGGLWFALWRQKWRLFGLPLIALGMATMLFFKPYDLLVSDDASKVALRLENGEFLFIKGRPDSFDAELWLRAHGTEEGLLRSQAPRGALSCDEVKCVAEKSGRRIAVALRKRQSAGLCAEPFDVVVTPDFMDDRCPNAGIVIDRRSLWQSGALGIRFTDGSMDVRTVEEFRGSRPWISRRNFLPKTVNPAMMPDQPGEPHE